MGPWSWALLPGRPWEATLTRGRSAGRWGDAELRGNLGERCPQADSDELVTEGSAQSRRAAGWHGAERVSATRSRALGQGCSLGVMGGQGQGLARTQRVLTRGKVTSVAAQEIWRPQVPGPAECPQPLTESQHTRPELPSCGCCHGHHWAHEPSHHPAVRRPWLSWAKSRCRLVPPAGSWPFPASGTCPSLSCGIPEGQ